MPCHHLIAGNPFQDGMHDRPLRSGLPPTPLRLCQRQGDYFSDSQVTMELALHDKDATPDNMTGFGNALESSASEPKIHRRLPFAARSAISADKVGGRRRAGNQENLDNVVELLFVGRA